MVASSNNTRSRSACISFRSVRCTQTLTLVPDEEKCFHIEAHNLKRRMTVAPMMHTKAKSFEVATRGKGTYEITDQVQKIVAKSEIKTGTVTVFVCHTSCSLIIMENAAPAA